MSSGAKYTFSCWGKPALWLPLFILTALTAMHGQGPDSMPHAGGSQDGWQEFRLISIDTVMTIIDRGTLRIYGQIDGLSFMLTTRPGELNRGTNVYLIAPGDTTVFDIRKHVGADGATLRLLPQGPENSEVEIFIADGLLPGYDVVDQTIDLRIAPTEFTLPPNYPNPFNTATTIRFTVPEMFLFGVPVTIDIFNAVGERVERLLETVLYPGEHDIRWEPEAGRISSGLYVYQVRMDDQQNSQKMLLVK